MVEPAAVEAFRTEERRGVKGKVAANPECRQKAEPIRFASQLQPMRPRRDREFRTASIQSTEAGTKFR